MPAFRPSKTSSAATRRPLKDPLRSPTAGLPAIGTTFPGFDPRHPADMNIPGPDLRKTEISEFSDWLRTQTNKQKLPFQERAVEVYAETARALDRWMSEKDIDGDFTTCNTTGSPPRTPPSGNASASSPPTTAP